MGFRGYLFFFLSIPFGLIQGFIEILFGFSLVYFLSDYGLVTPVSLPPWFPSALFTPTLMLVLVGFIRWISGFLSVVVTNLCHENFCYQTRKTMAASMLSVNSQNRISVAEMSNVFANLMPKAAMLIMSISDVLTRSFLLAMTLFGMLYISVKLTGVMLGFSLILVLPVIISRKFYMAHSALLYELAKKFIERLSHDTKIWIF
jgi:ABC-type multidrug transport system fused ATPase/permease subunit